jgi:hypothetical protein
MLEQDAVLAMIGGPQDMQTVLIRVWLALATSGGGETDRGSSSESWF